MAGRTTVKPDWNLLAAQLRTEVTGGWNDANAVKRYESHGGTLIHGRGLAAAMDPDYDGFNLLDQAGKENR